MFRPTTAPFCTYYGSEFLNHTVSKLLNKLLVEFTKSRPYRTTDNALVEGKNGAVIRKHIGYGVIAAEHDPAEHYRTPYEKFVSLPDWNQYLKSPPSSCSPGDAHERHRGSSANTKSQTHLAGQVPTKSMNAFACCGWRAPFTKPIESSITGVPLVAKR